MRILSASLVATGLLLAPAVSSATPALHSLPTGAAHLAQLVGWWEQQPHPNEARERYDRLPPPMRDYYNTLEYRIGLLDSWRGGDMSRRNPTQYRLMSDLIDQMRREQYAILQYRYHR